MILVDFKLIDDFWIGVLVVNFDIVFGCIVLEDEDGSVKGIGIFDCVWVRGWC